MRYGEEDTPTSLKKQHIFMSKLYKNSLITKTFHVNLQIKLELDFSNEKLATGPSGGAAVTEKGRIVVRIKLRQTELKPVKIWTLTTWHGIINSVKFRAVIITATVLNVSHVWPQQVLDTSRLLVCVCVCGWRKSPWSVSSTPVSPACAASSVSTWVSATGSGSGIWCTAAERVVWRTVSADAGPQPSAEPGWRAPRTLWELHSMEHTGLSTTASHKDTKKLWSLHLIFWFMFNVLWIISKYCNCPTALSSSKNIWSDFLYFFVSFPPFTLCFNCVCLSAIKKRFRFIAPKKYNRQTVFIGFWAFFANLQFE